MTKWGKKGLLVNVKSDIPHPLYPPNSSAFVSSENSSVVKIDCEDGSQHEYLKGKLKY